MSLQTNITVTIDGTDYTKIRDLQLSQHMNNHHSFSVALMCNHFEEDGTTIISKSQDLIGKTVDFAIVNGDENSSIGSSYFTGIITATEVEKSTESSTGDHIVIKGFSPTVLLDDGPHCTSYEEYTLADMVNAIIEPYSSVPFTVNPLNSDILAYTVQYNLSNFQFIKYLATRYGEWFYYDGLNTVFGTQSGEDIDLSYGAELTDFNLHFVAKPKLAGFVTNDYYADSLSNQVLDSGTSLNGYYNFMADISEGLFTQQPLASYHQHTADGSQDATLQSAVTKQSEGQVASMVVLNGSSRHCGIKIGSYINIAQQKGEQETVYGRYLVTSVHHTAAERGEYQNHFEAVPEGLVYPPYTNIYAKTVCPAQRAIVMENADTLHLGRVRVQFPWQTTTYSPWIRIAQPHGGAAKGFHFLPEVGEEVMVGFEGGNANMPFVLGSLYNGNATVEEFASDANDKKIIRTRTGSTIEFDDTDGSEKINIYDANNNVIQISTSENIIRVQAVEDIELIAKNIKLTADENIELGASQNVQIVADQEVSLQSGSDMGLSSSAAATIEATQDLTLNGQNITAEGSQNVDISGGVQTTLSGAITDVQGSSGKVEVV